MRKRLAGGEAPRRSGHQVELPQGPVQQALDLRMVRPSFDAARVVIDAANRFATAPYSAPIM
jgi:hypothetical protein